MIRPRRAGAIMLSARLGGTDGVSVEAAKWQAALETLGFRVRRIAGELHDGPRGDDLLLPWLAIEPRAGQDPRSDELRAGLGDESLVVVENLCSLPMNLAASRATADALDAYRGRVVFHHHDLPWQREHLAHVEDFPPRRSDSLHVTINDRSRSELHERGITAFTIRNAFDLDAPPGDRASTRSALGFADDELVVLQPTRAIARKDVPAAIGLAEALQARLADRPVRYWLTGPAEDGYNTELARVLATAAVPVTHQRLNRVADAYAAADVVVLPSTWEGFGNPVVEATIARRPLVARGYPVLDELAALGLRWLPIEEPESVVQWLRAPTPALLDTNLAVSRRHFSLAELPSRLDEAFASVGWSEW